MPETPFAEFALRCRAARPEVFLVLGSGLGPLIDRVRKTCSVAFTDIPGLSGSSTAGHRGHLTLGEWVGRRVLVGEGRLHYYEGHSWEVVTRPIQLAAGLGAKVALLTNAVGGIRDDLAPGGLMPVRDHFEWNRPFSWRVPAGPTPYAPELVGVVCRAGERCGLALRPGVYAAVSGPSYETPAEVRALRAAGADAVGMSTSREVLAGAAAGLRCAAVSLVTNRAAGLAAGKLDHADVLASAAAAADRLGGLLECVLADLG
jgi:purine-nucleoside phosphorylase